MPKLISVNTGFVTNSSSVVHHFPRELLEHPRVKAFIEKFGIEGGYVGDDLWDRSRCDSFLVSSAQKELANRTILQGDEWERKVPVNTDPDLVVVIYGDEYRSLASDLCEVLLDVLCERSGSRKVRMGHGEQYN